MLKNPQDRRAMRTNLQIREVMFSLMEKKPIHQIKVSEICKICQINRATFYDHYRDVFDLVQDMENDLLLKLQAMMDAVAPEVPPEEVSRQFFDFWAEHRQVLQLLITSERSREFFLELDGRLMPFFEKQIRRSYQIPVGADNRLRSVMEFVAMGYYRFLMRTLTEPKRNICAEAELCSRLSDACLELLFEPKQ